MSVPIGQQNPYLPVSGWQFAPSAGATSVGSQAWYDLTSRVNSWSGSYGKQYELGVAQAGAWTIVCDDPDEWLNPNNAASPWNTSPNVLTPYRQIRHWKMPGNVINANGTFSWTGNLLNATNNGWPNAIGLTGDYVNTTGFSSSTGMWTNTGGNATTFALSSAQSHDGSTSMLVTWPTQTLPGYLGQGSMTFYGPPLRTGYTYTLSTWVYLASGPAVTLQCNAGSATSTASTGAWQRVVTTFTATDGTSDVYLFAAGNTTSGQQVYVDSVQLEYAASASAFTISGPTIYPVFTGFVERYPNDWQYAGFRGRCQLTAVDAIATMARVKARPAFYGEVMKDAPIIFVPLNDGTLTSPTMYGTQANSVQFIYTQGGATTAASSISNPIGPGMGSSWNPGSAGNHAQVTGISLPASATGWTFEAWIDFRYVGSVVGVRQAGMVGGLCASVYFNGAVAFGTTDFDSSNNMTPAISGPWTGTFAGGYMSIDPPTGWHCIHVTEYSDGVNVYTAQYLDSVLQGTHTRTGTIARDVFGIDLFYMATNGSYLSYQGGYHGPVALFSGVLSPARMQAHFLAGRTAYQGDGPGQRIQRLLSANGWVQPTNIPVGSGAMGPMADSGLSSVTSAFGVNTLVSAIIDIAVKTEMGVLYAAPDGRLTLIPRSTYTNQHASALTFGENVAGGEIPYAAESLQTDDDPTYIYNDIVITSSVNSSTGVEITNATSQTAYGLRSLQESLNNEYTTSISDAATELVLQRGSPRTVLLQAKFHLSALSSAWAPLLGLALGTRVTVNRRSPGATTTFDCFVMTIAMSESPTSGFELTIAGEPIGAYQPGVFGDPVYGLVGSTLIATY
jgi:Carbohydrate binding domain